MINNPLNSNCLGIKVVLRLHNRILRNVPSKNLSLKLLMKLQSVNYRFYILVYIIIKSHVAVSAFSDDLGDSCEGECWDFQWSSFSSCLYSFIAALIESLFPQIIFIFLNLGTCKKQLLIRQYLKQKVYINL